MGKDIKEKYERVCSIKDKALSLVETQLNGNIENVDAKELGEVADIAKDMAELMKCCAEAEYYHTVTEAMNEATEEDKKYYMDKYLPETMMYYTPMGNYARQRDSRGRYMYTEPESMRYDDRFDEPYRNRMYFSTSANTGSHSNSMNYTMNDSRMGRAWESRRGYMEAKEMGEDKTKTNKELEKFMQDMADDMTEMIQDMDSSEKAILKQKLATMASKIV